MQDSAYTIRKAGAGEAEEAIGIIEAYCDEVDVTVRDSRADLERYLTMERSGIWLAWPDGSNGAEPNEANAVGCILLRPLTHLKNAGEIKRLYVRQRYRGSGIAKALLLALENYAAANAIDWLYLDTKQDLQAAVQFYERSGYHRCERYNDNPQATIFMRKQLL